MIRNDEYELLDSGNGLKWERFGPHSLIRPAALALWQPIIKNWQSDASFSRNAQSRGDKDQWTKTIKEWNCRYKELFFRIKLTDFGHVGLFPEHAYLWQRCAELVRSGDEVLNLFAYSGGASLYLAKRDVRMCHLDSSKGMVEWARQNALLNGLENKPIRWIVEDVIKFMKREKTRGHLYDGIIMDPPSFGRGSQGEIFKIEEDLRLLLQCAKELLSEKKKFLCVSCHTPGFTPQILAYLLAEVFPECSIEHGELVIPSTKGHPFPTGVYALANFAKR